MKAELTEHESRSAARPDEAEAACIHTEKAAGEAEARVAALEAALEAENVSCDGLDELIRLWSVAVDHAHTAYTEMNSTCC